MRFLVGMLVLVVVGTAGAVESVDVFGFLLEGSDGSAWDVVTSTSAAGEIVTVDLVLANPTLGGVTGWEACVEVTGDLINPVWTLHGASVLPIPEQGDGCFQVGISPLMPVLPSPPGMYRLATMTAVVPTPQSVAELRLYGMPGSTSFPDGVGYAGPDVGVLQAAGVVSAGAGGPAFIINGEAPVATDTPSFSTLKTIYR